MRCRDVRYAATGCPAQFDSFLEEVDQHRGEDVGRNTVPLTGHALVGAVGHGFGDVGGRGQLHRYADEAVRVFMAAYRT